MMSIKTQSKNAPDLYGLTCYDQAAWLLFDWLTEPPGVQTAQTYTLYSEPLSPIKHLAHTNMVMAGSLPVPNGYRMDSIHCFYGMMAESDRQQFRERYVLELIVLQKIMYQMPLVAIPDSGWVLPAWKDMPEDWPIQPGDFGETPRYILPLMTFYVRLIGDPFVLERRGNGLKFLPVFNGKMDRAVA